MCVPEASDDSTWSTRSERRWSANLKRTWLQMEGQAVRRGANLPLGRTILALCRKPADH